MIQVFNLFGASFTIVMLLMIGFWIIYLFQRRGGIVDIAWGLGFILSALAYLFLGDGNLLKKLLITVMVVVWAGRLSYHLYIRYRKSTEDDPRYVELLEKWDPDSARLYFLMMFIFQGVLVVLLSLPFLIVAIGSNDIWTRYELWGVIIWALGIWGESVADKQLAQFQADESNKGNVCQSGLWRYSRHPNYFFESVIWFGFAIFAMNTEWGFLALFAPLLMLVLLCKVSGIPLAEAQSLRSRGELYREYQRTTSAFVPWFPKK